MFNETKLSTFDKSSRIVLGTFLIVTVLTQVAAPAWLALVAAYLVLTARIGEEPLYALIKGVARLVPQPTPFRAAARTPQ